MKSEIKIGIIGLGGRGYGLLHTILNIEGIVVKAVCDNYEDRQERAVKFVEEKAGNTPLSTSDYKDILAMEEVEAVTISSSWADHIPTAIDAMQAGKYVGLAVG